MPIYEYRCAKCDRSFEAFVRPGDERRAMPALSRLKADARNVDVRGARHQRRRGGRGRICDGNLRHVERRRLHRRRMLRWRLRLSLIVALAQN